MRIIIYGIVKAKRRFLLSEFLLCFTAIHFYMKFFNTYLLSSISKFFLQNQQKHEIFNNIFFVKLICGRLWVWEWIKKNWLALSYTGSHFEVQKRYASVVSSVMTFKITDLLNLRDSGIDMFPSFKNDMSLTYWARSNWFSCQYPKYHHVIYLQGVTNAIASTLYF